MTRDPRLYFDDILECIEKMQDAAGNRLRLDTSPYSFLCHPLGPVLHFF